MIAHRGAVFARCLLLVSSVSPHSRHCRRFCSFKKEGFNPLTKSMVSVTSTRDTKLEREVEVLENSLIRKSSHPLQSTEEGRLDISVPVVSPTHLEKMKSDIKELHEMEEYEDLITSYRRDLDQLTNDPFSKQLSLKKELFDLRDRRQKVEDWKFRGESIFGAGLLGCILYVLYFLMDDFDRKVLRFPKFFKFWFEVWRLGDKGAIVDNSDARIKLVEWYTEQDEKYNLRNGEILREIISLLGQCTTDRAGSTLYPHAMRALQKMMEDYAIYKDSVAYSDLSRSILSALAESHRVLPVQEHTEFAAKAFEVDAKYSRVSLMGREEGLNTIELIRLVEGYAQYRPGLVVSPYHEEATKRLRETILKRKEQGITRSYDRKQIKMSVEEFLLTKLA